MQSNFVHRLKLQLNIKVAIKLNVEFEATIPADLAEALRSVRRCSIEI
jgi:hypothetical protein